MSSALAMPTVEVIYRAQLAGGLELRADGDTDGSTLFGHFTKFDAWYEINSWLEGHFLERVAKGSAKKTIKERRSQIRCTFDHGYDFHLGDKPLGPIDVLREDDIGVYYEVPLYDTDYNRDFVLPVLRGQTIDGRRFGSGLGASFRFRVLKDSWVMEPKKSDYNPNGIPERTISEYALYEFGPVVYAASPEATAGVRSLTDDYFERALRARGESAPSRTSAAGEPTAGTPAIEPRSVHSTARANRNRLALTLASRRSK